MDVICQHKADGSIIPLRIRLQDEDGAYQIYQVKGYKELGSNGDYVMPNGICASNHIWRFECKIAVFGREKIVTLFYNAYDSRWKLTY